MYLCIVFPYAESPWVITLRWDTYILKAFSGRFGFDALRISQIRTDCQKQSNGNAPWRCRLYMFLTLFIRVGIYIYIDVGLSALLGLTNQGNARAFKAWTGHRTGSTFLYVWRNDKKHSRLRSRLEQNL